MAAARVWAAAKRRFLPGRERGGNPGLINGRINCMIREMPGCPKPGNRKRNASPQTALLPVSGSPGLLGQRPQDNEVKQLTLSEFFAENPKTALAFSGGTDSAYLLYAAKACGAQVRAYYGKSVFQPEFELRDARRLAEQLEVEITVVPVDILHQEAVAANPPDRCYHCKRLLFSAIAAQAAADGYPVVLDGTNASDDLSHRPGVRALRELSVRSPLLECGITKEAVRRLSREAGLFTWNKPAYACLATRIPTGTAITLEKLQKTQRAEELLCSLGFSDLRVRMDGDTAKLQLRSDQLEMVLRHRKTILEALRRDYRAVVLDLEARDA